MSNWPLLSILIWLPIIGGLVVLLFKEYQTRWMALMVSSLQLGSALSLYKNYLTTGPAFQFVEQHPWITQLSVGYNLGVDGIAVVLIVLTCLVIPLALLVGWKDPSYKKLACAFLFFEGTTIGLFSATNALLFYIFFEASLLPLFFIIGIWGSEKRFNAATKFFIFNFFGSLCLLSGLAFLYSKSGSLEFHDLYALSLTPREQAFLFFVFLLAFAVKIPMLPFHTWLTQAHRQASVPGSLLIAIKVGGYGLLRFNLLIVPDACVTYSGWMIGLSLCAVVYASITAMTEKNFKSVLAYSSVAQMGLVTLGLFSAAPLIRVVGNFDAAHLAIEGSITQMISNTLVSAALFAGYAMVTRRVTAQYLSEFGGLATLFPKLAGCVLLFSMANCGLPGTSGFIGEFMVIVASFQLYPVWALIAGILLVSGAAYSLWPYRQMYWGHLAPSSTIISPKQALDSREVVILAIFASSILILGFYPRLLSDIMEPSVGQIVTLMTSSKY